MDDSWTARAYADEVRAEMARQHITARKMQAAVGDGLSSSAYQKYFVQKVRPVPSDVQLAVSRVLGVKVSELWRRAEAATADQIVSTFTPEAQEAIARVGRDLRPKRDEGQERPGEADRGA